MFLGCLCVMHVCLEFLVCSISDSFLKNENWVPFLYNTNRLSANLHVRVRMDSIKERTNNKKFTLLTWDRVPLGPMYIYSLKKPKLTLDLRLSSYLCTNLQASRNCRESFIIKPQAVASSITKWAREISSDQGKQKHMATFWPTNVGPHNLESKGVF